MQCIRHDRFADGRSKQPILRALPINSQPGQDVTARFSPNTETSCSTHESGQSVRTGQNAVCRNTGSQFLQFAFGIVLARVLVPADFGMIVTIQVFTGFVGMLASGGMGQSLIRAKEANTDDFNAVFTLQLLLGVLIYLGFFVSASWLAAFLDNPLYAELLRVSAISFC